MDAKLHITRTVGWVAVLLVCLPAAGQAPANQTVQRLQKEVQPLLTQFCYECHGEGGRKGSVAFDGFETDELLAADRELWWRVLKNVRAGLMPPPNKPQPSPEHKTALEKWIKYDAMGINAAAPDPGRMALRRLNRVEYRNTIRDLMGVDYKADEEFPPDDTGYGFDNIADVLTVSPLLLEKYMQAAETIVSQAVPMVGYVVRETEVLGSSFREADKDDENLPERERERERSARGRGGRGAQPISFYRKAVISHTHKVERPGSYRLTVNMTVNGAFDFDPGRARVTFKVDDKERVKEEFGWQNGQRYSFDIEETWQPGEHKFVLELEPLVPVEQKKTSVDLRFDGVRVQGPTEKEHWARPKNFERFFWKDVPTSESERKQYAREVLAKFTRRAFRRPVDDQTLDRLMAIAEQVWSQPGRGFEQGIAQAMVAVLASPRFLFRVEQVDAAASKNEHPLIDEFSLATRLAYFLWSTMPDDQLLDVAERGELRKNLAAQVKRMLADGRSQELIENFVGQWLQARDVEGISINARAVLRRDGVEIPRRTPNPPELEGEVRRAMRMETEMFFGGIVREDRSVLELIDSDYTYLNERLAKHYGIPDVKGTQMRKVQLPKDSPRGGVLTQGTTLVVTSNPTRTSPVKRGLFILDNILGMPPPPPPPDIPELEDAERTFKDRDPTLREALAIHASKPLCNSCHSRMDPLGLALENFNAMGMWREKERGQAIDPAGKLISGKEFKDIRQVKAILKESHRADFYRCLSEKLLTYALGRGPEYYDVETVDRVVSRLESEQGRFSAVLMGVIESAPFQRRRNPALVKADDGSRPKEKEDAKPREAKAKT